MRGKTTIIISHDPSLVRCADRVLVISTAASPTSRPTTGLQDTAGQSTESMPPLVRAGRRPSRTRGSGSRRGRGAAHRQRDHPSPQGRGISRSAPRPAEGARPPRQRQDSGQGPPAGPEVRAGHEEAGDLMAMTSLEVARAPATWWPPPRDGPPRSSPRSTRIRQWLGHGPGHRGRSRTPWSTTCSCVPCSTGRTAAARCATRRASRPGDGSGSCSSRSRPSDRRRDPPVPRRLRTADAAPRLDPDLMRQVLGRAVPGTGGERDRRCAVDVVHHPRQGRCVLRYRLSVGAADSASCATRRVRQGVRRRSCRSCGIGPAGAPPGLAALPDGANVVVPRPLAVIPSLRLGPRSRCPGGRCCPTWSRRRAPPRDHRRRPIRGCWPPP